MIDTTGMITVAEAAKRLNLSIEQVRRKLREGKLKGQRVGGQWFVDIEAARNEPGPLISPELVRRIDDTREAIFRRNRKVFDVVDMLRVHREEH
jgi:excisionase family DNA binding protein